MKLKTLLAVFSALALLFGVVGQSSAVTFSGTFYASQSCPAYQSKNKKTNPGNIYLVSGQSYQIREANKNDATWYRVVVENANPQLRWVSVSCGEVKGDDSSSSGSSGSGSCSTAGQEDSYVFALSWQPAFCETHTSKPECKVTDSSAYQAGNFTLHGLWPNKASCGTSYGFCGSYSHSVSPFCSYDAVPMSSSTLALLGQYMPSAAYGSCLQRHEWYKHGTCQTQRNADEYFKTAIRLQKEFNQNVAYFMQEHLGESVSTQDFFDVVDQAFFDGAYKRLQISCKNSKLVDVYINLPKQLDENASLESLMMDADPKFSNQCGSSFTVDEIGF
ncbi:hypothetical protein [Vibrio gazogenes]|uniref:Ribonuclease T2 n=1 Tax=Vibrio gazogenes DSM 21264 = NBRC 103151 TaxID=1123492 RepID=A0A1M5DZE7_VIBGA|nr:hypothetical protein [Vibrio gazogenes]USP14922.1 hypothetical protein MKS89_06340 [Vibrio gazogenes]SHF72182.1 ribonuclease T2 [Vibrio gazogenes DSM 21264] [Vibrio gazogenes DSM 21264 = NBRC 103151]SJN54330.1 Ribonuclease I precursor [Vibrio gazogenes]